MNSYQLINNAEALRLFFNEDVYLVGSVENFDTSTGSVLSLTDDKTVENIAPADEIPVVTPTIPTPAPAYEEQAISSPQVQEPATIYQRSFNFKYLGKNEKGILILVNDTQNPVSTPQGTELLRKLILSINLKNADFALVNYSAYTDAKFEHFTSFFTCKLMFSFGVAPTTLGLSEMSLHQLNLLNDIRTVFTHNLHDLDADLTAKKALWGTLKNLTI